MPVFSTVGEPAVAPPWSERTPRIVVFGGEGVRRRAYGPFLPALARAARELGAREICDVGAAVARPAEAGGVPIRALGPLPGPEVSALLLDSTAGFLAYPPAFLAKSTIFAAYCAHGVLPVCAWEGPLEEPPAAGRHYWDGTPAGTGDFQSMAGAARAWYAGHSLERQAAVFHGLLADEAAV